MLKKQGTNTRSLGFYVGDEFSDPTIKEEPDDESYDPNNEKRGKKRYPGKPADCEQCGKTFADKSTLLRHVKNVHEKVRDNQCPMCPMKFFEKNKLKDHVEQVHEKQQNFECNECHRKFSRRNNLNTHIRVVHQNIQLFQCEMCDMGFSSLGNMRKHQRNICGRNKPETQTETCTAKDCCRNK